MRQLERAFNMAKKVVQITTEALEPAQCKYCGSSQDVLKFGTYKGVQRWFCKKCKRKFSDTDILLPRMKTPVRHIAATLSMYYGGCP